MPYIVNNISVGHDPIEIKRLDSYNQFFEKVGDSSENIKLIPNFLSDEEIKYILERTDENKKVSFESQKDNYGNAVNWMHIYTGIEDTFKIRDRVKTEVINAYGFDKIKPKEPQLNVAKWDQGTKLNLHVDDLGYVTDNHIPTLVYLNDDYEGGEISFFTHDITIKPKVGDLLIFPGNMHYAHEVKEVLYGTRYTLPIWFTII
jgi:Rps23 Pro-64 3,4-dihydroxylase Tpa1-like proline 4-hydroxylase